MSKLMEDTIVGLYEESGVLKEAFTHLSEGMVILDKDGEVVQYNHAAEKLLSLPTNASFIEHMEKHFEGPISIEKFIKSKKKKSVLKLSRRKTGKNLYLYCTNTLIIENDAIRERILCFRDITESEMEDQLKQDFLSLISHKFFTPLTVLENKLQLFDENLLGKLSEKQKTHVVDMLNQLGKLKGLIGKLVNFVSIESKEGTDKTTESIDLILFLSDLAKESRLWFPEKKTEISVKTKSEINEIIFNRKYLRLIFGQLIDNALKFSQGDSAKIEIKCREEKSNIIIDVVDNGVGIPPELMDKIFDRFYQIEKHFTGNVEGVGLGLSYIKKLLSKLGGDIKATSEPGKGSTFTVTIPIISTPK
jgi:signal transduction histidine kinase